MSRIEYKDWAVTSTGDVVGGSAVEVRVQSTGALADLYDAETAGSLLSNPLTAEADGSFVFFVEPGKYDVTVGSGASESTKPLYALRSDITYPTIAAMALAETAAVGDVVSVDGERFEATAGGLTADGALVVDGVGVQWVSKRTVYADWGEFDADVRGLDIGSSLTVRNVGSLSVVATGEDFTTTGGLKVQVHKTVAGAIPMAVCGPILNIESEAASVANQTAMTRAIAAAARSGTSDILLPTGTMWVKADAGTSAGSGLRVNVPDNTKIRFIAPKSFAFKRIAAPTLGLTSSLMFMSANDGIEIEWHGVAWDGNEANCELDDDANAFAGDDSTTVYSYTGANSPSVVVDNGDGSYTALQSGGVDYTVTGSSGAYTVTFTAPSVSGTNYIIFSRYLHEQSANIKWLSGTGTPKSLRFTNCDVGKNRVGDGYHANVSIDYFMASQCVTSDATSRRVRADWQFSRYANYTTIMSDIVCNSFESEPASTKVTSQLFLINVYSASVFDLAGDTGGVTKRPINLQMVNVRCDLDPKRAGLAFCNFWFTHGEAVDCHFRGVRRIQRCKLTFRGGSLTVIEDKNTATKAAEIEIWHDQELENLDLTSYPGLATCFVEFDGVRLLADDGVSTGEYISCKTLAKESWKTGDAMVRTSIFDCTTPTPLDHIYTGGNAGIVEIRGGELRANVGIMQYGAGSDNYMQAILEPCMKWYAPAILDVDFSINPTTGVSRIDMSGEFNGEEIAPIDSAVIASAQNVDWRINAVMHVDSTPHLRITNFPGLRAKINTPNYGYPSEYMPFSSVYTNGAGYGNNQWRASGGVTAKGTTANRPALGPSDQGVMYFDTTLDAQGKPIWYYHTGWVDATGAVV